MPSRSRSAKPRFEALSAIVLAAFALAWLVAVATRGVPAWVTVLYASSSVLCFVLYAIDKAAAVDGRDRIPESLLLWPDLAGGWPGAIVAQQLLRHKTAKWTFRLRFWLSVAANTALFAWLELPHRFWRGG